MGYLKSIGTSFIYIATFLAAITFIPGLPPDLETTSYEFKLPAALNEKLSGRLNGAEKLFEGHIKGPEAFDVFDGILYTSLLGGSVSKIVGNKIVDIVRFGENCDVLWDEETCGRPLGLKFDKKGNLFVVDAYYGIFKVNVKTGTYEKIVDPSQPISGKRPMIPNSVDVASNGDLYWTDSSTDFKLYDGVYTMLADPSGRLIRYNAASKRNEVLLEKLSFANGLRLSEDESFLIVADLGRSRILKYHLKGPKAGKSEIFIESLPGFPDNIHSDGQGNFLVSLAVVCDEEHPQLSQSLAPHPYLRKMILRLMGLVEAPFKFLQQIYPNYYSKKLIHGIGHFKYSGILNDNSVIVLRLDPQGKILDVLDTSDGRISTITSAFVHDGYLWLGSFVNDYLARVPLEKALPGFKELQKTETSTTPRPTTTQQPTTQAPKKQKKTQPDVKPLKEQKKKNEKLRDEI
ncbi:adipocyte plasma membrane-associated protein [Fopius arisanus]|uniref:Adipocyte plasma membrane-associated protein n=1 Tax=Fopius arisanus TaxID=64838 RepID=A0A9R1TCA6_9HYME|nr:PREDICTED: adipocyte plasma membrane-associated protein-like [Fopius arisanus]XP_011306684.1 PREDICTED: adipocyte plasma membrane-associated protein-like [Fopius arisanus]